MKDQRENPRVNPCLVVLASPSYAQSLALWVGRPWQGKGATPCESASTKAERKDKAAEEPTKTGRQMIPDANEKFDPCSPAAMARNDPPMTYPTAIGNAPFIRSHAINLMPGRRARCRLASLLSK
jgi:hypothetical protein